MKFIPNGQKNAAKIVLKNGQCTDFWKCDQTPFSKPLCIFCQKKTCSTLDVVLDGERNVKQKWDGYAGKYKKEGSLVNGKYYWTLIADKYCRLMDKRIIWYQSRENEAFKKVQARLCMSDVVVCLENCKLDKHHALKSILA